MLNQTKDFSELVEATLKEMVEQNISTMEVKKEGTGITMLILESSLITEDNKSRVIDSYERDLKTYYLLR